MTRSVALLAIIAVLSGVSQGWTFPRTNLDILSTSHNSRTRASKIPLRSTAAVPSGPSSVSAGSESNTSRAQLKKDALWAKIRAEGGPLTFKTKLGALNPYGIYYGLVSIVMGLCWLVALSTLKLFYFVTRNKIDPLRRMVNVVNQIWGVSVMRLTRGTPELVGREKLLDFYKQNRAAMFVSNHNSWLDIPFVGHTIGWRNYKLVSKIELGKVPILGMAIRLGRHIMVDRSSRKSQMMTLKSGINMLKAGVHLCTFPEGTRSKSGRFGKMKNGAFKMAHKVGSPVIPMSIVGAGKIMPYYWLFPYRAPHGATSVIIHDPIESTGKTEDELAEEVRQAIIAGLPDDQKPLS